MNRRKFLQSSFTASALAGVSLPVSTRAADAGEKIQQELYELRAYRLKPESDGAMLHRFLEKAAIPAWNRIGCNPVGVFTEMEPKDGPAVFVLAPHPSMSAFVQSTARIHADKAFLADGAEYLEVPKSSPAFLRIDSWLLLAFSGMPKLRQPAYSKNRTTRIFELRTYESHSESKAVKKVEMFNAGEIEVMQDVGLGPIFFGQALSGPSLPHLAYMLSAEDRDSHKKHFSAFGGHPTWKKLAADPQYKDTVSKITGRFLSPTAYSQI